MSKTLAEFDRALAALAERSADLRESADLPRGREPAFFRALRAALEDPELDRASLIDRAVEALGARLGDRPLLDAMLELAAAFADFREKLVAAWRERGARPDAWAAERMVFEIARGSMDSLQISHTLSALVAEPPQAIDPAARSILVAALEARLGTSGAKRDRTSVELARGGLAMLDSMDGAPDATFLARIVESETMRAGKEDPELAIAALDALARTPALARLRALERLEKRIDRRKVQEKIRALASDAAAALGLDADARALLLADDGGLDRDARAEVELESGERARLAIDARGEMTIDAPASATKDDRRELERRADAARTIRADLARRLERALVEGRALAMPIFLEVAAGDHGILRDLARRIVWLATSAADATSGTAFRPRDRDGPSTTLRTGFEDVFGESIDPRALGSIARPAHPVELDPDELALWRERTASAAPFEQLFRPVAREPADALARFVGRELYRDELAAVARRGWRGLPLRGDGPFEVARDFPGRGAILTLELATVVVATKPVKPTRAGENAPRAPREAAPRVAIAKATLTGGDDQVARAEACADLHELTDALATGGEAFFAEWQKRKWRDPAAAWKEALERYSRGSRALIATRIAALKLAAPSIIIIDGRFAHFPDRSLLVELATGNAHDATTRDFVPPWKALELAGLRAATPTELVLALARSPAKS